MTQRPTLKDRLARGDVCLGPFMKLSDPAAVEVFALAGFDHVIVDLEHGPLSVESAQNLIRAAELRGLAPLLRVRSNDAAQILRALDVGAEGVHIPQIATAEDARAAVQACFYHPQGSRGVCRYVRAAGYSSTPREAYFLEANWRTLPVLHIEGQEGIEALPEILQVPDLGVVFLGPYDLSQSCGVPGQTQHPTVVEKMQRAVELARGRGVVVGTFIEDAAGARLWSSVGVQYLCYSVDVGILYQASARVVGELREALQPPGRMHQLGG